MDLYIIKVATAISMVMTTQITLLEVLLLFWRVVLMSCGDIDQSTMATNCVGEIPPQPGYVLTIIIVSVSIFVALVMLWAREVLTDKIISICIADLIMHV